MPKFIQEKFQVNYPEVDAGAEGAGRPWASSRSARVKKGTPGREDRAGGDPQAQFMNNARFFQSLPPGMDGEDQEETDQRVFNESIAGNRARGHNAGDVTQDLTAKSVKAGFDRKECCPTDDMYTREHNDAFYDAPEVDGVTGFVERNNYLDRL
jgi:hypothetical protein